MSSRGCHQQAPTYIPRVHLNDGPLYSKIFWKTIRSSHPNQPIEQEYSIQQMREKVESDWNVLAIPSGHFNPCIFIWVLHKVHQRSPFQPGGSGEGNVPSRNRAPEAGNWEGTKGWSVFLGEEHQYHQFSLKINDGQKTSKMMLYVEASKNEYTIYFGDVCTRTLLWTCPDLRN